MRYSQPQGPARIDWANPITLGLVAALLPSHPNRGVAFASKPTTVVLGARTKVITRAGYAYKISSDDSYTGVWCSSPSLAALTMVSVVLPTATNVAVGNVMLGRNSGGTSVGIISVGTDNIPYATHSPAGTLAGLYPLAIGELRTLALTVTHRVEQSFYDRGDLATRLNVTTNGSLVDSGFWLLPGYASTVPYVAGGVCLQLGFSRVLSAVEIKSLSSNPWQIFESEEQLPWVPDDAGAGVSSVYSDIATAFNVRGAAQIDLATSYNLRNSASQDISPAFSVRVAAPADLSLAYTLRGAASQDITSAFSVRGAVPIDLSPVFNVRGLIQIDESASYSIRGAVSADITPGYSIMNAGVVASDLITSYQVRGIVQRDMAATYSMRGSAQGDLPHSYVIRGAVATDMSPSYAVAGSVAAVQSDLDVNYSVFGVTATCPTAADIAAAVRADLSAELARIDAAISSRSTVAAIMGYDE